MPSGITRHGKMGSATSSMLRSPGPLMMPCGSRTRGRKLRVGIGYLWCEAERLTSPHRVIYFVRDDELVIVAFAHQGRRPGY